MYNKYYRERDYIKESDRPNERQMSAENYLKDHNIEGILTEMINYLLHKKSKSPIVAMIKYLGGLLTEKEREENQIVIPDPQIDYHPIIEFPKYNKECNSLLKEYYTQDIFSNLMTKTSKYGINVDDIVRVNNVFPKNNIGCLIADADCLVKFETIYKPIICKAHNLDINSLKDYTQNNFNLTNLIFKDIQKVDISSIKGINKISISISRNLFDSPFVCFLNIENRTEKIAGQLTKELDRNPKLKNFNKKENPNKINVKEMLKKINYDFDFLNSVTPNDNLIQKQRIIYFNEDESFILLINYCDNFQIIRTMNINEINNQLKNINSQKNPNDKIKVLNDVFIEYFNEINDFIRQIQYYFGFEFNHNFGYLTSNISLLGRGLSITTEIDLEQLCGIEYNEIKLKEKLEKFDKYTDTFDFKNKDNDEKILIFTSSPKISQESINEFIIQYFEKIQGLAQKE